MLETKKSQFGFTLLEILLVIAAIGILAGIVIVAINPGKQFGDQRNAQRWLDLNLVANAIYQYKLDVGHLPDNLPFGPAEICQTGAEDCSGLVNLSILTDNAKYLSTIPIDPGNTSQVPNSTGYSLYTPDLKHIILQATGENDVFIRVER